VSLNKLFARRRQFCFTYVFIYLLTYSPYYVLGKLFARVHRISVCVIVYVAKVLTLSPLTHVCLFMNTDRMHLTYLFTYLLLRSKIKTSINWFYES